VGGQWARGGRGGSCRGRSGRGGRPVASRQRGGRPLPRSPSRPRGGEHRCRARGGRPWRGRRAGRASSADLRKATAVAGAGRAGWPERTAGRRRFPNGGDGGWLAVSENNREETRREKGVLWIFPSSAPRSVAPS
jgi:hypothetical protein